MTSSDKSARIDYASYKRLAPAVVAALTALGQAIDDSGLEKSLTELLKIRVSQINGCAFCLQLHLNMVQKLALPIAKINLLSVWHDVDCYSVRERVALEWAETLTMMAQQSVDSACFDKLTQQFSIAEIGYLTAAIANINAWNRIAGGLKFTPMIPAAQLIAVERQA
ncbi:carboxymuconolactone decarboxylase family protein [Celerinatantimonas yamalensis]|uniref:Carboxymuconolactone decarboxylase family protein n=1 Tax=Celerinatantimonas yamalensis TaxID=559956 RepID=A0ABW9GAV6_9GAMM